MRGRVFHADGLKKIGTGLQIDSLNWLPAHSAEYLNLVRNIVRKSTRIHGTYHTFFHSARAFRILTISLKIWIYSAFNLANVQLDFRYPSMGYRTDGC